MSVEFLSWLWSRAKNSPKKTRLKTSRPICYPSPFATYTHFPTATANIFIQRFLSADFCQFNMFPAAAPSIYQSPKCLVTYGSMGHVDTNQAPRKGKPWSSVMSLDFVHKVRMIRMGTESIRCLPIVRLIWFCLHRPTMQSTNILPILRSRRAIQEW